MIGPEHVVVQHQPMVALIVLGLPQRHKHVHLAHAQVSVEVKLYFFFNPQLNTFLGVELNIIEWIDINMDKKNSYIESIL